jgi:protein-disulfide isomerase
MLQVFGKQIRFVFRNLPLTDIHMYALAAAMAAEAAGLQGKYWEMNELIYENQQDLNGDLLFELADQLGLDAKKFKHDLQSTALQQKISNDIGSAEKSGVPGTPTFFVNGKMFAGGANDLLAVLQESVE